MRQDSMDTPPQDKLPITETLCLAYDQVLANRVALVRGCVLPIAAIAICRYPSFSPYLVPLQLLIQALAGVLFSVTCYRILILGPGSIPNKWGVYFTRRELRYLTYSVALGLGAGGFLAVPLVGVFFLGSTSAPGVLLLTGIVVVLVYVSARLFLLLPGLAVDQAWTLRACWATTRDHVWRLVALTIIAGLLVYLPHTALQHLLGSARSTAGWLLSVPFQFLAIYPLAVGSFAFLFVCPAHLRPVRNAITAQLEAESGPPSDSL